ncbi:hypothetical protein CgunFtcFv8_005852 [Champsocephalus gunnari]|uniref:Uncharacterized protein n=1 Tax=Champsocephalus gunnari TaxID=52237 RepID=A0AAN8D167_CHAGU|nr:hypothetical protein CgunFtcFv8_005852 [Champsocephalus gunnari]
MESLKEGRPLRLETPGWSPWRRAALSDWRHPDGVPEGGTPSQTGDTRMESLEEGRPLSLETPGWSPWRRDALSDWTYS